MEASFGKHACLYFFIFISCWSCTEKNSNKIAATNDSFFIKTQTDLGAGNKLLVVTRNISTSYFEDKDGQYAGVEHDLVLDFMKFLGKEVKFKVVDTIEEVIEALKNERVHFAAAGLTETKSRREMNFLFGPPYQKIEQKVICNKKWSVENPSDLVGRSIVVVGDSSYVESLMKLQKKVPEIKWKESSDLSTEQILEDVWKKRVDCTIADSHIFNLHRRYLPELKMAFKVEGETQELVWIMPRKQLQLKREMERWFKDVKKSGRLSTIMDYYYGYMNNFDYYDTKVFLGRVKHVLPKYEKLFKQAAEKEGFDWKFLAAVAYQESHWNPRAKSPTGVGGMMMLTQNTAIHLGIKDRYDPKESVFGGARYLKERIKRVPSYIPNPDRVWMGLAAYNVGYAHLRDARSLTVLRSNNPNTWAGVKSALPFLSNKIYYSKLPHGYARGHEPVAYVDRIRNYYDLLKKNQLLAH